MIIRFGISLLYKMLSVAIVCFLTNISEKINFKYSLMRSTGFASSEYYSTKRFLNKKLSSISFVQGLLIFAKLHIVFLIILLIPIATFHASDIAPQLNMGSYSLLIVLVLLVLYYIIKIVEMLFDITPSSKYEINDFIVAISPFIFVVITTFFHKFLIDGSLSLVSSNAHKLLGRPIIGFLFFCGLFLLNSQKVFRSFNYVYDYFSHVISLVLKVSMLAIFVHFFAFGSWDFGLLKKLHLSNPLLAIFETLIFSMKVVLINILIQWISYAFPNIRKDIVQKIIWVLVPVVCVLDIALIILKWGGDVS